MRREGKITLGERLAVALVSIIAAGFTVALMWSLVFFRGAMWTAEYAKATLFGGVIASLGAGVAGFLLGVSAQLTGLAFSGGPKGQPKSSCSWRWGLSSCYVALSSL